MIKVYLAKSNKADLANVKMVRSILNKRIDVNVFEYSGGKYKNTDVVESDCLICITENNKSSIILGKGLYDQLQKNDNSYIVVSGSNPNIKVIKVNISKIEVTSNDWTKYAKYNYKGHKIQSLDFILPEEIIL